MSISAFAQPTVIPKADNYIACPGVGTDVVLELEPQATVDYYWYSAKTGGTLLASAVNSYTVTNFSPPYIIWVEPRIGATTYPRDSIVIHESQSCGGTPVSCAVNGTLLFKEDFDGNDPDTNINPTVKPTGIPQVSSTYTYVTISGTVNGIGMGRSYSINKYSLLNILVGSGWYRFIDHTYPSDTTRGYMLQVNAGAEKGQFYEATLNGLCPGTKLYFSAWLVSLVSGITSINQTNQIFTLEDNTGHIIAQYYTGNIPDSDPNWKQYGFEFTVPPGLNELTLRIINNGTGTSGNDFCMDDIEIHFCTPEIVTTSLFAVDTAICPGTSIALSASYNDNGTLGNNLVYRWEHSLTGNVNNPLEWTAITDDSSGISPLNVSYTVPSMSAANVGYYRLVVGGNSISINQPNCRASSSPMRLQMKPHLEYSIQPKVSTKNDTATIEVCVKNTGTLAFQSPIYYTLYKDTILLGKIILSDSVNKQLLSDSTFCFSIRLDSIHKYEPLSSIWISIDDKSGTYPYQQQCVFDGRRDIGIETSCAGDSVSFNGIITEGGTSPTYQWFVNDTLISGANDTIFTYVPKNGDVVKCRAVSDETCAYPDTVYSQTVIVIVHPKPDSTDIQTQDTVYACYNTSPTLSASTTSVPKPKFTWYDTQTSTIVLATGATFTPSPALTSSRSYFVSVQDTSGHYCENDTNKRREIKVIVYDTIKAGVIGSDYSICKTGGVPIAISQITSSTGGSDTVSHKWQVSTNGSTWSYISGANAINYTPDTITITKFFRRVDIDEKCADTVFTNMVKVTVDTVPNIQINAIVAQSSFCVGSTIQISHPSTNGTWTWSAVPALVTFSSTTTNPTNITGVTAGDTFITYKLSNGNCQVTDTKKITVMPQKTPTLRIGVQR